MAFEWTDPVAYPYREGGIFLGESKLGEEVGISTEKGLLTIAPSRTGKGAALIIPNLLRWKQSAVIVDPKGEAAEESAERRAAMGQLVGVIDPYHEAQNIPDELRASINPLDLIDPTSRYARLQLEDLGDGFIRRFDPKHGQWDNKAAAFLSGFAAHVMTAPPEHRTLRTVRKLMMQPQAKLETLAGEMIEAGGIGGLSRAAGLSLLEKFSDTRGIAAGGFENALTQTSWIDDEPFEETLEGPRRFDMRSLKAGNGSLYLVLHPDALKDRGGFLRLFTRMAMSSMTTSRTGGKCLFILDEFFSLGKMDNILSAAGSLPGYGIHLWPFLQDLGQLRVLYGDDGATSFFANSDAHIFFGNADPQTLDHVSSRLGIIGADEIGAAPVGGGISLPITGATVGALVSGDGSKHSRVTGAVVGGAVGLAGAAVNALIQAGQQAEMNAYLQKAMTVGKPRYPSEIVREIVARKDGDDVAKAMIVFAKGRDTLYLMLVPYFRPSPQAAVSSPENAASSAAKPASTMSPMTPERRRRAHIILGVMSLILMKLAYDAGDAEPQKAAILWMTATGAVLLWIKWLRVWRRTPPAATEISG